MFFNNPYLQINNKKISIVLYILSVLIFPLSSILYYNIANDVKKKCDELDIKTKNYKVLSLICGFLGLSIIPLIIIQTQLNKVANHE